MKAIITLGLLTLCAGCVNTQYQKSITITKDRDGRIISTVETETITQPNGSGWPARMEYLRQSKEGMSSYIEFPK